MIECGEYLCQLIGYFRIKVSGDSRTSWRTICTMRLLNLMVNILLSKHIHHYDITTVDTSTSHRR